MRNTGLLLIFLTYVRGLHGQNLFGCPTGWELFEKTCYKFERDDKLIFEEADAACWVEGASLLNVDTFNKHKFVTDWLMKRDSLNPTVWFTGGRFIHSLVVWDELPDINGQTFWEDNRQPLFNETYIHIAYALGRQGYQWRVVSPSVPSAYICEIPREETVHYMISERGFDYGMGFMDHYDVRKGPIIVKEPSSVVVFGDSPSVYIECAATGNPFPDFSWKRDGNESVTSSLDGRYTITGGRFTIQYPEETRDHGSYQCLVENEYGRAMSNPAQIIFGYMQQFSPVRPEDVRANKFEGTRISCQAPASYPDAKYQWFQWSTEEFIFEDHPYIFVSSSGYLYFSEVQPTDNRKYFCVVTLTASTQFRKSNSQPPSRTSLGVWLLVSGTEHGFFEPFIYTHTFPSPAVRGSRIRLECIAYGSLPLVYTWFREDGRPFQKGTELSDLNRVLTIPNAQIASEGNYVCMVQGRAGVTRKIINLIIEAKPYFPFGIGDKLVDPQQTLKWRCKSVARPAAVYTWYKDGVQIVNQPGEIEVRRNSLYIRNIQKERDEGMYQCGATNVHGTTFSTGQLKVLSFAPNFNRYPLPPMIQIPLGGNYTIPCRVEAAPVPDVTWLKNGGALSVSPGNINGHYGMTFENDLVISNIEYGDQGVYTCMASNINGEAKNTTTIDVIRGIAIMQGPSNSRVMVNRTAFMYCQASYDSLNFDLTYIWKFNGHVIHFLDSLHFVMSKKAGMDGLYIRNAQYEHSGVYTCEARTTLHTDSKSATLYVDGPPAAPAGAYVDVTSITPHSVRLIWTVTAEMDHGSPISRYDIEAESGYYPGLWRLIKTDVFDYETLADATNAGLRPNQRTTVVEGLFPHVSYSFRVRAINDFGRSHLASKGSVPVKTPATAPVKPPNNIRGIDDAKVGTLTVVWDELDISEQCGPGIGYTVYLKKKGDQRDWIKHVINGTGTTHYTHLVGKENYYLPYQVKVNAFNVHGAGPNSTEHTIMSAEGMPVATVLMGDCDNYNGTAFSMSWTPVEDTREVMKGRLKGYRIRYWHADYPDFITWRDLYGQHDSTIIIGLEDNTNYWASVQVMNYAGVGPIGEIRLAETFHLPPQQYPRHVKVHSYSKHSVRVTWQGVSTAFDEETLQGYILRVWKVQEDIRTAEDTIVDKTNNAIISNLQIHTVYVLRVLGYSIGGEGSLSPHVYFTVEGGNVPFDPTTTQYCFGDQACGATSSFKAPLLAFAVFLLSFVIL